ncbi:polysaccharide deacetylase family protein [Anaerovorax sp. IOR16]|uniref:polysaccharide deacetylase family protein n=1 Tax=Anaerovorax sp. IOR16 TaxID=2773458 RepID=UPI001FD69AF7|nr:polysaccharide deacetylase family protein [Anaerovorax sp. IOR16]
MRAFSKFPKLAFLLCGVMLVIATVSIYVFHFPIAIGVDRQLPIYSVETSEKKVAISFDASWGNEHTKPILDILNEHQVKTTFFLVSLWIDKYPEDVLEISKNGHEIGNHSSTHPDMAKLSEEQIKQELSSMADKVEKITGKRPVLFRPPFGSYNNKVIEICEDEGYCVIQWDVDSLDWKNISTNQIVERVTRNVKPGSIVLFHNNAEHVEEYLPIILDKLQEDGYKIVPVGEIIYEKGYHINHAGKQVLDQKGKVKSDAEESKPLVTE